MKWIKLTKVANVEVWVNMDNVKYMERPSNTALYETFDTTQPVLIVSETPTEIFEALKNPLLAIP